jgi:outer membrane lipoprotein LolB
MLLHISHYLQRLPISYGCLFILLCLLSACSQQATKPIPDIQQSTTAIPSTWHINAKLGIRNTDKSGSVTLRWQQHSTDYIIRMSGPLGQGSGVLSGNEHRIAIQRPNKETLYSDQPTELIRHTFGWDLPLAHLNYWVRGLASPLLAIDHQLYNASNTLDQLTQAGWSLRYSRYRQTHAWLMPHRIVATKDDVTLTLIIKKWEFPEYAPSHTPAP